MSRMRRLHKQQLIPLLPVEVVPSAPASSTCKGIYADAAHTGASAEHGFRRYTTVHALHACDILTRFWSSAGIQARWVECCCCCECDERAACGLLDSRVIHIHAALHHKLSARMLLMVQHGGGMRAAERKSNGARQLSSHQHIALFNASEPSICMIIMVHAVC